MGSKKGPYYRVEDLFLRFSEQVEREQGIRLTSYGFNWAGKDNVYDEKVHVINISYNYEKGMKYDDAKKCFFTFVDELIGYVNHHEEFKDIFYHFPIGYEDFHLSFSFDYHFKGHLKKDDVWLISIFENRVYYSIVRDFDTSNKYNPYITRSFIENFDVKKTDAHNNRLND